MTVDQPRHPASWWAQFPEKSERFDLAYLTEELGDLLTAKIASPLLRREAEIALEVVVRSLNKPASEELAVRAGRSVERLEETVARLVERSGGDFSAGEAQALLDLMNGRIGEAAYGAEAYVKTQTILRVFVGALRMERFDTTIAVKMLAAGQDPAAALASGSIVGRYNWWPNWLLKIVTERAMSGTLDEGTIAALDRCAYAELSPAQSNIARRLLNGEDGLIAQHAVRLEHLGERDAAEKLRQGDLTTVALAVRLMPI
ncbi:hypothetical protein [Actinoplanes sp. NPDC051851]|uniref:hypothetical protein n=1 Tax=Actinoplanes sp. NPDC051851 TaxID=3154753 RepID=UPI00341690F0